MSTELKQISLSRQVRNGRCGTKHKLLIRYFEACDNIANGLTREQARRIYVSVFNVIMETVCDDLIAKCWRGWCLDNIGKPLSMLKRLSFSESEKQEVKKLEAKMRLLSRYFLR